MAEKLRRIKKEGPLLKKRWRYFFFVFAVSVIVFAVAIGTWSLAGQWRKRHNQSTTAAADQKDLTATICRNSDCFWLNQSGQAFYQGADLSGSLVLSLADKTSRELKVGSQLLPPQTLGEILFLKNGLRESLGINVAKAETADPKLQDFDFITTTDWILRFSIVENAHKTLETLKKTLEQIGPVNLARLEYIDLRIPNKVYYKLK
ncbi:MAG: hypothetical protein HY454_01365 [Parcubacteria group bacterium]|nr:hypothetical protein [Parcubacteria group bacterium]